MADPAPLKMPVSAILKLRFQKYDFGRCRAWSGGAILIFGLETVVLCLDGIDGMEKMDNAVESPGSKMHLERSCPVIRVDSFLQQKPYGQNRTNASREFGCT